MIFVKGYGQMCNNILQYAHAYVWGKENNVKVVSMRFAYKYRYFEVCNYKYHRWPVYLFAKMLIKLQLIKCFFLDEPTDVTPDVLAELKRHRMVAIDGWQFRFPELFMKYRTEIKDMFAFKSLVLNKIKSFLEEHAKADGADVRLAVHIRRGDYKVWMGGKYFFNDDVYIEHIRQFLDNFPVKKVSVFICTNDRNLNVNCYREALGLKSIYCPKGNEAEDLCLLSQCDYIIGVKSTFSLMAAFYNNRPIYWIMDKNAPLQLSNFSSFEKLFMTV